MDYSGLKKFQQIGRFIEPLAVFLARTGAAKEQIRVEIARRFGYELNRIIDQIRPRYSFDISCQGTAHSGRTLAGHAEDDHVRAVCCPLMN